MRHEHQAPSYESVRKMLHNLYRLRLTEKVREETVETNPVAFKRVYYHITPKNERQTVVGKPLQCIFLWQYIK